jgi:NAD(P)-dependent dehydrogenase (short-subunit alcohol dehydrogenase family)
MDTKMKIAITGHTRGIGRAIADVLAKQGHEIVGLSRSNGYDLTVEASRHSALDAITNCDVFINNALPSDTEPHKHTAYIPVELLYQVHRGWRGNANKIIIAIGSNASDTPLQGDRPYQVEKIALASACKQLATAGRPRIIIVKPGCTDTDSVRHFNEIKMDPVEVANAVSFCLNAINDMYIQEITVLPGAKYYNRPATNS